MYVSRGGVGGGINAIFKKKVGSRIMRFQTNDSNKCDVSKKKKKTRETIVLCRIN